MLEVKPQRFLHLGQELLGERYIESLSLTPRYRLALQSYEPLTLAKVYVRLRERLLQHFTLGRVHGRSHWRAAGASGFIL